MSKKRKQLVGLLDGKPISHEYAQKVFAHRERMRQEQTEAERYFDKEIAQVLFQDYGIKRTRQRVFFISDGVGFIVDYYFDGFNLAIEIDGTSHLPTKEKQRDEWRDALIMMAGKTRVLRFTNKAVMSNPSQILDEIIDALILQDTNCPARLRLIQNRQHYCVNW